MKALKRYILLTLSLLAISAQKSPQTTILHFESTEYDFGHILEESGKVSHTFTFENRSSSPVVIIGVETTCGCTAAEFSKKPILAGEHSQITLTFDPAGRPGAFSKRADIYDASRGCIASLTITGDVEPRPLTIEEAYPFEMGGGVRFSATFLAFGYLSHGETKQSYIECMNTSDHPITLQIRPTIESGLLRIESPVQLAPNAKERITLCYSAAEGSDIFRTAEDILQVWIDGAKSPFSISSNTIVVERYSPSDKFPAPQAQLNKNIANFGTLKHDGSPKRLSMIIMNLGGDPLRIDEVEAPQGVSISLKKGITVSAGEELSFDIEFDPSYADYGYYTERLRLFTNDPVRPMRQIRLTASIVQ